MTDFSDKTFSEIRAVFRRAAQTGYSTGPQFNLSEAGLRYCAAIEALLEVVVRAYPGAFAVNQEPPKGKK